MPWALHLPTVPLNHRGGAVTLGSQMLLLQTLLINRGETRELDERGYSCTSDPTALPPGPINPVSINSASQGPLAMTAEERLTA